MPILLDILENIVDIFQHVQNVQNVGFSHVQNVLTQNADISFTFRKQTWHFPTHTKCRYFTFTKCTCKNATQNFLLNCLNIFDTFCTCRILLAKQLSYKVLIYNQYEFLKLTIINFSIQISTILIIDLIFPNNPLQLSKIMLVVQFQIFLGMLIFFFLNLGMKKENPYPFQKFALDSYSLLFDYQKKKIIECRHLLNNLDQYYNNFRKDRLELIFSCYRWFVSLWKICEGGDNIMLLKIVMNLILFNLLFHNNNNQILLEIRFFLINFQIQNFGFLMF
eukprot:TRINITY_DN7215_c0_g1_i7.p1 TRINITY_DN7215_c0_g1~~TRINITY_DN7215_c0_g1_i7.p1  ORF type:complete len:278 (+),score=-11.60 TRINITY_DN7215_c0_g1_i7:137-970(+)